MQLLKIGHYTNNDQRTGTSVFLFDKPATGAYLIAGSSPATRELHILDSDSNVNETHGVVFTGGSAFGLGAVDGVMQYLCEKGIGKIMPHGCVPIVPGAAIYDLANTTATIPNAQNAYQACLEAKYDHLAMGRIGAGTGATIGKLVPDATLMTGGFGFASTKLENNIEVSAYVVVNAVGDIRDQEGQIVAGARNPQGDFSDCESYLLAGYEEPYNVNANTTLVAVFTNAKFSKIELKRIAKMALAGMARAISPIFTRYDGDILFCFSLGEEEASEVMIGTLASEMVRRAIVNAVADSVILK